MPKSLNGTGRRWWLIVETEREKKHHFLQADSLVWHDLLQSVTTAVSSLFLSPLPKSTVRFLRHDEVGGGGGCCGRPDSLFPLYRVPGGLLAACFLTGILVGKSDSRTMNSVEWWISLFPKGFLLSAQPERWTSWWKKPTAKWRGCAGGERDAREELGSNCADCIKDTEITKLRFSPQDYFCFSPSSIIFVTPSSSFHPVILFMLPSCSYMISSSLTWLLFSFPLLSIIFSSILCFLPSKFLFYPQFNFPPFLLSPTVTHLSLSFSYSSLLLIMFVLFLTCCLHLCHLTFSLFKVATNYMRNGEN